MNVIFINRMMDFSVLEKYDSKKMYKIYDKWPELALEFYEKKKSKIDYKGIEHIIFAGMGGSGTIGDICSSILSKTNMHVTNVKGYLLPKTVDENTLIVTTSVSGNTSETLTVLDSAQKHGNKIVAFSSGGKMKNYCLQNQISYYEIPQFHSPRASLTAFLYSILNVLEYLIPIEKYDVIESIERLKEINNQISSSNLNENNPAINLANWIKDIPLIYYPFGLQAAAVRFKNSLQENVKIHVIIEDVIEACHNGIVAWEKSSIAKPILIEGKDDYIKTKERWEILKTYFNLNKIEFKEVFSTNGGILAKLIHLIYFLDYTSIYLAVLRKIDPTPVKSIDFVKERL